MHWFDLIAAEVILIELLLRRSVQLLFFDLVNRKIEILPTTGQKRI